jgi:hypothetical protein
MESNLRGSEGARCLEAIRLQIVNENETLSPPTGKNTASPASPPTAGRPSEHSKNRRGISNRYLVIKA